MMQIDYNVLKVGGVFSGCDGLQVCQQFYYVVGIISGFVSIVGVVDVWFVV